MKDAFLSNYINQLMVLIPKGTELIRDVIDEHTWISSNSKMSMPGPKTSLRKIEYETEIKSFYISKYPVTEGLYRAITKSIPTNLGENLKPVVNVSWFDAIEFCNLLSKATGLEECYSLDKKSNKVLFNWNAIGYRLPTDAEWQYACKAGSTGYRYDAIDDIAWYFNNSQGKIHEVGQKRPNAWGLYDTLGNVWEWCWDVYDEKRYGSYRIFRGGSWSEEARGCGASCRRRSHPSFRIDDLGFRIAKSR